MSDIKSCEPQNVGPLDQWAPELLALPEHEWWVIAYAFEGQEFEPRLIADFSECGVETDDLKLEATSTFAGRALKHYISRHSPSDSGALMVTYDSRVVPPLGFNRENYWHKDGIYNGILGALYFARSDDPAIEVAYGDIDESDLDVIRPNWRKELDRLPTGTVSSDKLETGVMWVSDGNLVHKSGVNQFDYPVHSVFLRVGVDVTGDSLIIAADQRPYKPLLNR